VDKVYEGDRFSFWSSTLNALVLHRISLRPVARQYELWAKIIKAAKFGSTQDRLVPCLPILMRSALSSLPRRTSQRVCMRSATGLIERRRPLSYSLHASHDISKPMETAFQIAVYQD
jgi:hypothetical protein